MNMQELAFGFQVLQALLIGGIGFYVYMSNKDETINKRIDALEISLVDEQKDHGERLATLEERSENHPTHDDLGEMHDKINKIANDIGVLSGQFNGVSNLLNTLHNFLLAGGNK